LKLFIPVSPAFIPHKTASISEPWWIPAPSVDLAQMTGRGITCARPNEKQKQKDYENIN
jgi:hypothetical protein